MYALRASDRIVQRIQRHTKPHVAKEGYIKAFDPAVPAAMKRLEATLEARVHRVNESSCGKLLKAFAGEVAERLKAAVC